MSGRRKLHRYVAWAVIVAAAATIAIALWQFREAIAWRWYLFRNRPLIARAREQILGWENSFAPAGTLTGALNELQSDGEPGFRAIASLLEDEDPRVWVRTAKVLDCHFGGAIGFGVLFESVHQVVSYVRSLNQRSLLRFLIIPAYSHGTDWRRYFFYVNGKEDAHWCWYWSGEVGRTLRPAPDGINFCEEVLYDRFSYDGIHFEPEKLKPRAVDALAAMWSPEVSSDGRNRQALAALERFIRSNQDADLRLQALYRLALRSGAVEPEIDYPLDLSDWEVFAGICPHDAATAAGWISWGEDWEEFEHFRDPGALAALLHLDHPRMLRILSRMDRDPAMRDRIHAVRFRREFVMPVTGPEWFPIDAAARRHLDGPAAGRAAAFLCLVESPDLDAVDTLRRALSKETVEDLRGLLKCCLYSLGEAGHAGEAAQLLEGWLGRDARMLEGGFSVSDAVGRILRAGDRSMLDRVAAEAIRKYRLDLLFAMADAVEEFPLRKLLSEVRLPFAPMAGEDRAGENEALSAWWQAHREKITWDARRRVFIAEE